MSELSIALDVLRESRLETLKSRVMEAISAEPELKERREFLFVFEFAEAIAVLRAIAVPTDALLWYEPSAAMNFANLVLTAFERFQDEQGKEI